MVFNLMIKEPWTCLGVNLSLDQSHLSPSDASSTEFNPESKHPVVSSFLCSRHIRSAAFTRIASATSLISTGDWHARAQPRADGRDNEVGEETDNFKTRHKHTEYVATWNKLWTGGFLDSQAVSCVSNDWTVAGKLYGNVEYVEERHRHRFEVKAPDNLNPYFYRITKWYSKFSWCALQAA